MIDPPGTVNLWPFIILFQVIPAIASLSIMPFIPDTPSYLLLIKNNRREALAGETVIAMPLYICISVVFYLVTRNASGTLFCRYHSHWLPECGRVRDTESRGRLITHVADLQHPITREHKYLV